MKSNRRGISRLSAFLSSHISNTAERMAQPYAKSIIEKQRLSVLLFSTLGILISVPLSILGLITDTEPVLVKIYAAWLVMASVLAVFFLKHLMSLSATLKAQLYLSQFTFSAAMIYSSFHADDSYYRMVILADMSLSLTMLMLSLISHFKHTPHSIGFVIFATYLACSFISGNREITGLMPLFAIICVLLSFLGIKLLDGFKGLQTENIELRKDGESLSNLLGVDGRRAVELLKLAKKEKPSEKQTIRLLNIMDDQSKERLFAALNDYLLKKRTQLSTIAMALPELSTSETEICRLILQGKKQTEICAILGKTNGNITSQRAHIRAKLKLKPKDNLGEALLKRLKEHHADALPPKNFSI